MLDLASRGRSKSAPPAFSLPQTMMGFVDSEPLISAETYNLPRRPRTHRASSTHSAGKSRRSSLVSTMSASVYSQYSRASQPGSPMSAVSPSSPLLPRSLGEEQKVYFGLAEPDTPGLSPQSVTFTLSTEPSTPLAAAHAFFPTDLAASQACEAPAQLTPLPPSAPIVPGFRKLRKIASLLLPHSRETMYIDQASWSFYFPRDLHEEGCGCRGCVKLDPSRERGEERRRERVRGYEKRGFRLRLPGMKGWRSWVGEGWPKVGWSAAAKARREEMKASATGGAGAVKVSQVYEVEW